jgi:ubiquinone/menaquinone biosynthesis C-methylase UbiE
VPSVASTLGPEARAYFGFLAEMGITKHLGALDSTLALIEACRIAPGQRVLDVGCGPGVTASLLAREYGCTVVGVDLLPRMLDHARARARREGVGAVARFVVADTLHLPHADHSFDAVIAESLLVFVADPATVLREMVRVARPGGVVGLNEMTLLRPPMPVEVEAAMKHTSGIPRPPPTVESWAALLREAGLHQVAARARLAEARSEAWSSLKRWGWGEMVRAGRRALRSLLRSPTSRAWVTGTVRRARPLTRYILHYVGYGAYTGCKRET